MFVPMSMISDNRNRDGFLEGSLNRDQRFPEKVLIEKYPNFVYALICRLDQSMGPVQVLMKRRADYFRGFKVKMEEAIRKDKEFEQRLREEYPSDDEYHSAKRQKQDKHQKQKKPKQGKRKAVEEEFVAPRLSEYRTFHSMHILKL